MSDIKNKFRGLFGKNSSAEGDAENSAEKRPENIAEYPDEIHEEAPAVADDSAAEASDSVQNETVSDDVNETSEADVAVKEEDSSEIEQDAKSCFNSTYHDSLDDKIKSIRENALNTYAKENNNSNDASDAGTEENSDASDDDMKIMSFGDDEAKKDEGNSNTRNYDMTQLIELLKEPKGDSGSNNDTVKTEDKPKEHNLVSDTDNELKDDEPAVNEYPHNFEYIEECQNKDLFTGFRKSAIVSTVSLIATFILTVLCLWVEIGHGAGLPFEHMLQPGYYGKVFAMASLQLLALCVLVNLDGIRLGLTKLSVKKAAPEAVAVVDPHRHDGGYPHKNLSGVGIAFKLAAALNGSQQEVLDEYADPTTEKYEKMVEEIRRQQNFTSLRYHRLDDFIESIGLDPCKLCTYCFNGKE